MTRKDAMPVAMGIMMGAMGLMMLHGFLTEENTGMAGVLFVVAHVVVVAFVLCAAAFGLHRRWAFLARAMAHRPSLRHVAVMLSAALTTAGVIHLVHGGPSWT